MAHPDIQHARTLPSELYTEPAAFARLSRALDHQWHWLGPDDLPEGSVRPYELGQTPLLLSREGGQLRLLSNVCTHRGMILVQEEGPARGLRCGYHGRRFGLDGCLKAGPTMAGPDPTDDLPAAGLAALGPMLFGSVLPRRSFAEVLGPVQDRLRGLPWDQGRWDPDWARDFELSASFLAWCDNYLEGLHIPFVHPGLSRALDPQDYRVVTTPWASIQIGTAAPGQPALRLPPDHPDAGRPVAGIYIFLFPCTALNIYPWGVSVNSVVPLGPERCRIRYRAFVWEERLRDRGAGADLYAVEAEDQAVVSQVQRGLRSRLYRSGRYAPAEEQAVFHFHQKVAEMLAEE